jgi:hypothetical protein
LLVLGLKLANALLLGSERFANASVTGSLFIDLDQPSPHGCLSKLHVAADLAHAQTLFANHLHHLQLELRVECSSLSLAHVSRPGEVHLSRCPGRLDQHRAPVGSV